MSTKLRNATHGKVRSLASARTDHLAWTLRDRLRERLQGEQAAATVDWGLARFFPEEIFEELEPETCTLAADWLAFEFLALYGGSLAQEMAEDDPTLTADERAVLLAWAEGAVPGFFRVMEASEREATLSRIPDEVPFVARTLGATVAPGNVVMTWLLPTESVFHFGLHAALLADGLAGGLCHALAVEMALLGRQRPQATWNDLYRTAWPRIMWYLFLLGSGADVTRIQAPPGLSVLWDGQPVEGAPDWWREVASWVRTCSDMDARIAENRSDGAERLWWDAALALRPRKANPQSWLAAVLYVFRRYVLGDGTVTQADVAAACGVPASAVGRRSRQIVKALGVQPFDLRYVDLLDADVRALWEIHCLSALGSGLVRDLVDASALSPETQLAIHRMLRDMARRLRD